MIKTYKSCSRGGCGQKTGSDSPRLLCQWFLSEVCRCPRKVHILSSNHSHHQSRLIDWYGAWSISSKSYSQRECGQETNSDSLALPHQQFLSDSFWCPGKVCVLSSNGSHHQSPEWSMGMELEAVDLKVIITENVVRTHTLTASSNRPNTLCQTFLGVWATHVVLLEYGRPARISTMMTMSTYGISMIVVNHLKRANTKKTVPSMPTCTKANSWAFCQVDAVLAVFVKPKWANIAVCFVYFSNATYHNLSIHCFADVLDWRTATSYCAQPSSQPG
jgi:hypothetical protein